MASQAAKDVKLGFWLAGGFWLFGIIMLVVLALCARALMQ